MYHYFVRRYRVNSQSTFTYRNTTLLFHILCCRYSVISRLSLEQFVIVTAVGPEKKMTTSVFRTSDFRCQNNMQLFCGIPLNSSQTTVNCSLPGCFVKFCVKFRCCNICDCRHLAACSPLAVPSLELVKKLLR